MFKKKKAWRAILACLPVLALDASNVISAAQAQSVSADKPEQTLREVNVAAPVSDVARAGIFGDRKVLDTPFSVMGLPSSLIRDQQARRLSDLVTNDPSVRSAGTQNSESEAFQVRGLTLLVNEVAFDGLYGLQPVRRSGLGYAERVEIFKGPNAVVNGISPFGSFGGVINIVPKRAGPEALTDVVVDYSSRETFGGQVDISRRFGEGGAFGARLNAAARGGETQIRDSKNDWGALDLALDYRSGRLRATLDLGYQKDDFKAQQQPFTVLAGVAVPAAPDGSVNLSQLWGRSETEDERAVLGVYYDIADRWTVSARYGQLHHTEDFRAPTAMRINTTSGEYQYQGVGTPGVFDTQVGDLGLRGRFATGSVGHELAVNATYYYADNKFSFTTFAPIYTSNLYSPRAVAQPNLSTSAGPRPGNERTFKTLAVADTLYLLGDTLQATLGMRYQSIDVTNYVNLSGNASGVVSGVIQQSKASPVMAVLYKVNNAVSVYGNASEGLAPGPQAPGGTANVGTVLPPIEAKSYEVGAKADYGKIGAGAALFQTTQQVGITNPATNVFGTDGEAQVRGLELSIFGSPLRSLKLVGGVTLLDAEQTKTAGGVNDGKTAVGIPETLLSAYAEWATPFVPRLSLTGRLLYTGDQYVNAANTQSIPDWTRVDLGVKYVITGTTPITLRGTVENVADRNYWAAARNGSLARGGPRAVFASAELNF